MKNILFVISNNNHLLIFKPIIDRLLRLNNLSIEILNLGSTKAETVFKGVGVTLKDFPTNSILSKRGLSIKKIKTITGLKPRLIPLLESKDIILIASDVSSFMRLLVKIANKKNIPVWLFQDGNIPFTFPKLDIHYENNILHKFYVLFRKFILFNLSIIKLEYLIIDRYGISPVSLIFVWGQRYASSLHAYGIDKTKINVIGSPKHDAIFHKILTQNQQDIKSTPIKKILIATALPLSAYVNYRGLVNKEVLTIIKTVKGCFEGCSITIKIHPSLETTQHYEELLSFNQLHGINILKDENILDLIQYSDLFFTSFSTAGIEAISLNTLTIFTFINFSKLRYRYFIHENDPRIMAVKTENELKQLLNRIGSDHIYREEMYMRTELIAENYFANYKDFSASEQAFDFITDGQSKKIPTNRIHSRLLKAVPPEIN